MKKVIIAMILCLIMLTGCVENKEESKMISAHEAKKMMDTKEVVIVDVRTFYEYEQGHIKDAINVPLSMIEESNKDMPEKDEIILIYCQSGNRSKQASQKFLDLGYQQVYDFGGINDWTYGVETSL